MLAILYENILTYLTDLRLVIPNKSGISLSTIVTSIFERCNAGNIVFISLLATLLIFNTMLMYEGC